LTKYLTTNTFLNNSNNRVNTNSKGKQYTKFIQSVGLTKEIYDFISPKLNRYYSLKDASTLLYLVEKGNIAICFYLMRKINNKRPLPYNTNFVRAVGLNKDTYNIICNKLRGYELSQHKLNTYYILKEKNKTFSTTVYKGIIIFIRD
jgi:hypothetical protein